MRHDAPLQATSRPIIRRRLRDLTIRSLASSGCLKRARLAATQTNCIFVLTLHRVVTERDLHLCRSPRGMVLREDLFVDLLTYLKANTELLSPNDTSGFRGKCNRPKVLLTFDDGWLDNFTVAQPHMASTGVTACFFVPTRLVGKQNPFWPEKLIGLIQNAQQFGCMDHLKHQLSLLRFKTRTTSLAFTKHAGIDDYLNFFKQLAPESIEEVIEILGRQIDLRPDKTIAASEPTERVMSWEQLRFMANAGHRIGSHGCAHMILPLLAPSQSQLELSDSAADLEEHIPAAKKGALWLSYPNGSCSDSLACEAEAQGYKYAFTNSPGRWCSLSPPHALPRINTWDGTLTDGDGRFSKDHLEYALYWKTRL